MIRDDFLLRQVREIVELALRVVGRAPAAEVEARAASVAGLDVDLAARLAPAALLRLLDGPEGLDAERALALGLGLAARALERRDGGVAATALALIDAALRARPALGDDAVGAVMEALAGGFAAGEG